MPDLEDKIETFEIDLDGLVSDYKNNNRFFDLIESGLRLLRSQHGLKIFYSPKSIWTFEQEYKSDEKGKGVDEIQGNLKIVYERTFFKGDRMTIDFNKDDLYGVKLVLTRSNPLSNLFGRNTLFLQNYSYSKLREKGVNNPPIGYHDF